MALTLNQILARLIAVEATLTDNQTALDNLATRRELKNLIALLTAEVDSLRTQVENLDQTILSTVLREYLDDRFYQKSEYIDVTHGVTDAASPVLTNDSGLVDTTFLPPSVVDHGELTGLADNDHTQYYNDTENPIVASGQNLTLNIDPTDFLISGNKLQIKNTGIDHGDISGLADDDHSQYVPVNASRGFTGAVLGVAPTTDLHLSTKKYVDDAIAGFSTDHGDLSGLTDDDHTQYFLANGTRSVSGSILPATNNLYDIGSSSFNFRRIYSDAIIASGIKCTTHPLGLGMKYGATSHSLTSEDVIIGGKLEVDDQAYFDNQVNFAHNLSMADGRWVGNPNQGATFFAKVAQQTPDAGMFITGVLSNSFIMAEYEDREYDFAHALQTNPTLFIQSANQSQTEWISFAHNQTDGVIGVGKGGVEFVSSGVNMFHIDGTLGEVASERQIYSVAASTLEPAGTTVVIDWSLSNTATLDLGSASGNVTVSMWHTESGSSYVLKIIQSATARTITWPATIKWESGSIPTLSTTEDAVDMAFFVCVGSTLYGSFGSNYS